VEDQIQPEHQIQPEPEPERIGEESHEAIEKVRELLDELKIVEIFEKRINDGPSRGPLPA